jgi:enoyl-CoA hydratase/carnithine racemase
VALAHEIAAGPIRAMVRTRALVRRAAIRTLEDQLDDEAQLIAESAAEAHLSGLVARLVDDGDLRPTAEALAREIANGPIRAMVRTRALVRQAATRTLEEQLDDEAQQIARSASDPEGREGVRAFVGKRAPDFRGA